MKISIAAAWMWWSALRGVDDDFSGRTDAVSQDLRLNSLCRLQSDLWALDQVHMTAVLLRLPGRSPPPFQPAQSPYTPPVVPWPLLPHELLGVDLNSMAKLGPKARQLALSAAWEARSGAVLQGRQMPSSSTWALPALFGWTNLQSSGVDQTTLEGQLVTLGCVAASTLLDEGTWKMYMAKMVAKRSWRGGWFGLGEPEGEDARVARLQDACRDVQDFAPPWHARPVR